jgi:hypothetical protein
MRLKVTKYAILKLHYLKLLLFLCVEPQVGSQF